MRIDSVNCLLVAPASAMRPERTPNIFLTPSPPGGGTGRPFARKNRLSMNKNLAWLLASSQEARGKLTLPLDRGLTHGRSENILA
jgi:hypothetical protein